jgi:4-oxalocrotonate tautomerase
MWPGRTVEQKRRLCKAITDAMVEHAGAKPDCLHVILNEVPPDSWAKAGVMGIDSTDRANEP